MLLAEVSIKRPVFITMVTLAMVLFGIISYTKIGVNLFPDVEFPMVTVTTIFKGASPETVELKVTDKIEEAINTISGVKRITSYSLENISQVIVEFELEKKIDVAAQDVRDKIASIRKTLPADIDEPIVEKLDIGAAPIMSIVYSSPKPISEKTKFAKDVIKERLQRVPGVGSVKLIGGLEREIRIWVSTSKMIQYQLTIDDIKRALMYENIEMPGGKLETGERDIVVKVKGEIEENINDFKNLYIAYKNGYAIKLGDVAKIEDGLCDRTNYATLNGVEAIALQVKKQSGTNVVKVADLVKAELNKIKQLLSPNEELKIVTDSSKFVKLSFNEVLFHLIFGGILAILIVFVFLRNIKTTLISALALPTSVITTFAFMKYLNFTFNNLSMLALSLSIGMLIDDAIVVLENIYRHQEEEGRNPIEAASYATSEIGLAVLATTFSIVAVFLPVAVMEGMIGRFFYEFGMTVTFAVLISLFVSFTLTPMLCSKFMKVEKNHSKFYNLLESIFKWIENTYVYLLKFSLKYKNIVIIVSFVLFILSLNMTKFLKSEFIPKQDKDQFNINIETPVGSSIQYTALVAKKVENILKDDKRIVSFFTTIGADSQERSNFAVIYCELIPKSKRLNDDQFKIMNECREKLKNIKEAIISVEEVSDISLGGSRQSTMQFGLAGSDLKLLEQYSKQLIEKMKNDGHFVDIDTDYKSGKPEARVYINRDLAARLYVSTATIASTIKTLVNGEKVSKFKDKGEQYDVNLKVESNERNNIKNIEHYFVKSQIGTLIELKNLVDVVEGSGPSVISRNNRQRQITFYANLKDMALSDGLQKIKEFVKSLNMKPGYSLVLLGKIEKMEESFRNIFFAMALGIILMYMIIASQFESFIHPFTIMISLPLSIIGAILALILFNKDITIISLIGIIMLLGLVAKNAILLVDYTNTLRERGYSLYDAILKAGAVRLRPILMTTSAMIFGMLPIAFAKGSGSELQSPMAVCVVGGLISSTILTLLVVPAIYITIENFITFFKTKILKLNN